MMFTDPNDSAAKRVSPDPKPISQHWSRPSLFPARYRKDGATVAVTRYPFAGTEYYSECYCGTELTTGAAKVADTDCNTACSGDGTQPCGGGNRLTLFNNPSIQGPQPNTGIQNWTHIGCYTEGAKGRALGYKANLAVDQVSGANCTAACKKAGFILAGTEYGGECYCGNTIANNATLATDGCVKLCNANQTEVCGGANRLNIYDFNMAYPVTLSSSSSTSTLPLTSLTTSSTLPSTLVTATTASTTSSSGSDAVLSSSQSQTTVNIPQTSTTSIAVDNTSSTDTHDTNFSGEHIQHGFSVNVDIRLRSSTTEPDAVEHGYIVNGYHSLHCYLSKSGVVRSTSAAPTTSSQPKTISNYNFYGCQTEATNARALSAFSYVGDTMTLESCQAFCSAKGSTYFGTEYGRECYCGESFGAGSVAAPASDCTQLCAGNKLEYCGNGNRLSVYVKNGTNVIVSSTSSGSGGSTTSTGAASGTTTPAAATGFPKGWTSQGCWQDGPNGRIMPTYQDPDNKALTPQSCAQTCFSKGYNISGTEYYSQCFCGNAIYNGGKASTDQTKCNTPCSGDSKSMCGGPGYLSIVSNGAPPTFQPPVPQTSGLNSSWTYQGCFPDNLNNKRTLPWQLLYPGTLTPSQCLYQCSQFGYSAAGLEYGQECYCGDPDNLASAGATKQPETDCNIACAGNASAICGGGSRLSTYYWTGSKPLWQFSYPAGNNAGTYSNLVGGVVTPLMTMQSITGKVTFLEKGGTGAANSTGAYELDLTYGDRWKAWREMHVKTDIFCSAGLILPDKAARQLTIGGWSLDSTYGVRLYWPDGSPGVNGTNDWEEDVNNLRLQNGRWYPSAMGMANGSILVIGGEEGSNGAAVPTLEILPATGGKPLTMPWLARTDPNNLYPFAAVLPGGGIFVGYWNEALIMDENTFATTKQLPNMPGAVNDPKGGRTYPLEGTAVLLPQYAPYTDPLGILMCGGSTAGAGLALDNCVSIQPEVPNAAWTLERMPSKRVMSCMAPLPDGTYLIANGARQGVAGFGLATDPNLNAVLYDPRKAVGSRMSVMANTTVARLYHSEAITLLDGRVLVTGSDPQDGKNPEEMRVEVFTPPYLLAGLPRPSFTVASKDWAYGAAVSFTLGAAARNGGAGIRVSLLGAVSSTHGNSMGARTLFPAVSCGGGTACTVTAPPGAHVAPPGWYQMFVLDGDIPAVGVYVRIGGDPAKLGNWPPGNFKRPGV
ncbi:hypothetical protein G7054_g4595 [Neopestalotiopsis clavispora]|nr:hypothetical protein G7054_g4595 [Neopestalotiopsis clavispora]